MAVVLKVDYQGDLHRLLLSENFDSLTYQTVWEAVQKLYPMEVIIARYLDEDNDMCTLCEASFPDFVNLASEHNGKKVLKLFLSSQASSRPEAGEERFTLMVDEATPMDNFSERVEEEASSAPYMMQYMTYMMKMGMGMFKNASQRTFKSHNRNPSSHHSGLKALKFLILQLHKNDALDAISFAALAIHVLPKLLSRALDKSDELDQKFKRMFLDLRSVVEDVRALVTSTPGLEQCASNIDDMLANEGCAKQSFAALARGLVCATV